MKSVRIWVMAARVRTLPAAVAPVLVGTALAGTEGTFKPLRFACALIGSIFIQIGTNLANDYSDARRGADTEDRLGPVRVTAAPARHKEFLGIEQNNYIFEGAGFTVYFGGDSLPTPHLAEVARRFPRIDVALLPINGRDAYREAQGLVGNMDVREAAELADRIGADLLIPTHYDMFARNPGYPDLLVRIVREEHPRISVLVPSRERPFIYTSPARARA